MFSVIIAKMDGVVFYGESFSATLPGTEGELTVLKNHVPLITVLKKGKITVRQENKEEKFQIDSGILEVSKAGITVLI